MNDEGRGRVGENIQSEAVVSPVIGQALAGPMSEPKACEKYSVHACLWYK